MLKKILATLLTVCILSGLLVTASFAESNYKTGRIAFFKDGAEIFNFAAGDTVTAKVKVKSAKSTDSLMFMLMLYQDDMLIDMSFDTKAAAASAVEYSTDIKIPENTDGLELSAVLWDNLKSMNAICSSSILPVSNINLIELMVNGEPLEDFSMDKTEYTVTIDGNETVVPTVTYKAVDNGIKVEIKNPELSDFPGKAEVKVSTPDGSLTETYTINYEAALVTDLKAENSEANVNYHVYSSKAAKPGFKVIPNYTEAGKAIIESIDPELEGLDCITSEGGSGMAGKPAWQTRGPWISFKLGRDADIIILQQFKPNTSPWKGPDFLTEEEKPFVEGEANPGWEVVDGNRVFINGWEKEGDGKTTYMKLSSPFDTPFTLKYTKSFKAGDTVVLPTLGESPGYESQDGVFALIKYKDEAYSSAPSDEDADLEF